MGGKGLDGNSWEALSPLGTLQAVKSMGDTIGSTLRLFTRYLSEVPPLDSIGTEPDIPSLQFNILAVLLSTAKNN